MAFFYAGGLPLKGYFKYLGQIASGGSININDICASLGITKNDISVNNILAEPQSCSKTETNWGWIEPSSSSHQKDGQEWGSFSVSVSYNASTGVVTASDAAGYSLRRGNYNKSATSVSCSASTSGNIKLYLFKEIS